jgi:hypothetical protein
MRKVFTARKLCQSAGSFTDSTQFAHCFKKIVVSAQDISQHQFPVALFV